jgi:hypothetical protein
LARAASLLLAAAILIAAGAAQAAPASSPRTTTTNALTRLLNDTAGLRASDAKKATRRRLAAHANGALRSAFRRPCSAAARIERYRALLRRVAERPTAPETKLPGPASIRGTLDRDALAVSAGLKQLPHTRRCGGGGLTRAGTALTTRVRRSSKRVLRMHVTLPVARWDARRGGGNDFIGLNMDGTDAIGGTGDPGVPAFTRLFAVPRGARMSVKVTNARGYTLDDIDLFPKQPQAVDEEPPGFLPDSTFADRRFRIDRGAYRGRGAIPRRLAFARMLGRMRDVRVGAVQVPGAQYDAKRRRARIFTSMDVTVRFRRSHAWVPHRARTAFEQAFTGMYRSTLVNSGRLARATRAGAAATPSCGEDYLIVTTSDLLDAAQGLIDAKTGQGMRVSTHVIEPGAPAADIRAFIRGELNSTACTRPAYVLLLGDITRIPSFTEQWCSDPATCTVTSDLSYSLDGVGTDAFADVMLGRIPVASAEAAKTTVQKIVTYETQLPAPPGDDFYNHATVTSNFDGLGPRDGRGFTLSAERMRAGLRSRGHVVTRLNSAQSTADIQLFKDNTPIPDELKRPNTTWTDGRDQVVSELNAGRFLFVHRDHGSRLSWANPSFTINDVALLNTTSTKLPVVIAINCSSASFQFAGAPSLDERLLTRGGGGAVAVIGDTDISPTGQNDQLTVGYADAMFPATVPAFGSSTPLKRMGQVLNAGKAYMSSLAPASQQLTGNVYREMLIWHVLGDPSMEIRTATPQSFDPTTTTAKFEHRRDSYPVGDPSFQVRVTAAQAGADGTLATLLHGTEPIGRATVAGGAALITPTKRTDSANLSVALERDNFIAKTLPVVAPVPTLTLACPADVNKPQEDNAQVSGKVTPLVSGATVKFRVTRPDGSVATQTTTTNSLSQYLTKILMPGTTFGIAKIEAFYDGELKYGADDASCIVPVD